VIGLLVVSAVLVAAFVPLERRAGAHALIPRELASNRRFAASFVAVPFLGATFFGAMLYLPQFMQEHLGYSPLGAGAGVLPFLATFAVVSFVAGPLYARLGAKRLAVFGAACVAVAPLLFSFDVGESAGYAALVPGMVILGIGVGAFTPTATTAGVTAVDSSETSLAGGVLYMAQVAGGSIGLGLTTTVFAGASPPFVDGVRAAFRLDAGLALVAVAVAVFFIGGTLGRRAAAVDPAA
jgi:MFS family permease